MKKSQITTGLLVVGGAVLIGGIGTYLYQQYLLTNYLCYGIKGFKFRKVGIDNTIVDLNLKVENKADLKIDIKRMMLDIYANGTYIATINQDVTSSINPYETTLLPMSVSFNPKQVLGSVINILGASPFKETSFRFKGKVVVKKFGIPIPIPFDFTYSVTEMTTPSGTSVCDDKKK